MHLNMLTIRDMLVLSTKYLVSYSALLYNSHLVHFLNTGVELPLPERLQPSQTNVHAYSVKNKVVVCIEL